MGKLIATVIGLETATPSGETPLTTRVLTICTAATVPLIPLSQLDSQPDFRKGHILETGVP
jgi:hypothetical protein